MLLGHGAHLDGLIKAAAHPDGACRLHDLVAHLPVESVIAHHHEVGPGETVLPCDAEKGGHKGGDTIVQIGIGHHHQGILGRTLYDGPLTRLTALWVNHVFAYFTGAHKGNPHDIRVLQHRVRRPLTPMDDIPHARGEADLVDQLGDLHLVYGITG